MISITCEIQADYHMDVNEMKQISTCKYIKYILNKPSFKK